MSTTIEVCVYSFDELSEKAKEKVLDHFREVCVQDDFAEYPREVLLEMLAEHGIFASRVYWSTDRDRFAYLDKPSVDAEKCLSAILGVSQAQSDFSEIDVRIECENYARGCTKNVVWTSNDEDDEYRNKIQEFLDDMLDAFLKDVEKEYENALSDENVADFVRANEYVFRENGEVFR